ncbi:thioredoxin family protein [bacterium]|nr:thioredoxin family protein [bacterium]
MKHIKIYGTGCKKCQALFSNAQEAISSNISEFTVEKITDMEAILSAGILSTPVLVVDGKKVITGQAASVKTIKNILGID